jgi:diaminohydroxyphosphoribosylaminopyrimidine deaminase/5-amino-6-(5-phosphoribosylamino)uracil reductase
MATNIEYMNMALETAFSGMGRSSPNPAVGAVIVRDGKVLSVGRTCACGCDHAELDAINKAGMDISGSELYVSLEPCCHYGKTPPCTGAIIKAGIKRVFIPMLDPNGLVSGKGVSDLKKSGIEVVLMRDMYSRAKDIIRPFGKYIQRNRPFLIHKSAVTLDGRIAAKTGDSRWISSKYSRYIVHRLRSIADAIIVGKNTMSIDNPSLNIRPGDFPDEVEEYFSGRECVLAGYDNFFLRMLLKSGFEEREAAPERVVVGLPVSIDYDSDFFNDDNYVFFVNEGEMEGLSGRKDYNEIQKMADNGRLEVMSAGTRKGQAEEIAKRLYERGRLLVVLEGGGVTAGSFYDAGEIDQFMYFISPRIAGSGVPAMAGEGVEKIGESPFLKDVSSVMINDEILISAYREEYSDGYNFFQE